MKYIEKPNLPQGRVSLVAISEEAGESIKKLHSLGIKTIKVKLFVLVSTVDVFKSPIDIDENTKVDVTDLHAYGKNRYKLEQFLKENFTNHLIVRLPGLVGSGLRKILLKAKVKEYSIRIQE